MGRKSIIQHILEKLDAEENEGIYIIVYDFRPKVSKEFYYNLRKLEPLFINKSCILVNSLKKALAIKFLVKHYGGLVRAFKIEKEIWLLI